MHKAMQNSQTRLSTLNSSSIVFYANSYEFQRFLSMPKHPYNYYITAYFKFSCESYYK